MSYGYHNERQPNHSNSNTEIILNALSLLAVGLTIGFVIFYLPKLPDLIRFGKARSAGTGAWQTKYWLLFMPTFSVLGYLVVRQYWTDVTTRHFFNSEMGMTDDQFQEAVAQQLVWLRFVATWLIFFLTLVGIFWR